MKNGILFLAAAMCGLVSCASEQGVGIVAHRGYWNCEEGGMSHNSIASLKAACEHGFWGTEFDVNITADGQLLVFHDSEIDGKMICEYNKSEFDGYRLPNGEPIPLLDEYLALAKDWPETTLVLELKPHADENQQQAAVDGIVSCLKSHGLFSPERVIFISFSMNECRLFSKAAPGFTVQYLGSDSDFETMKANGVNGIDMHFPAFLGDPKWKEDARENGFSINVWTVNKDEDIRRCLEAGVDFITTNEPELTRRIMKEMGIRERR